MIVDPDFDCSERELLLCNEYILTTNTSTFSVPHRKGIWRWYWIACTKNGGKARRLKDKEIAMMVLNGFKM